MQHTSSTRIAPPTTFELTEPINQLETAMQTTFSAARSDNKYALLCGESHEDGLTTAAVLDLLMTLKLIGHPMHRVTLALERSFQALENPSEQESPPTHTKELFQINFTSILCAQNRFYNNTQKRKEKAETRPLSPRGTWNDSIVSAPPALLDHGLKLAAIDLANVQRWRMKQAAIQNDTYLNNRDSFMAANIIKILCSNTDLVVTIVGIGHIFTLCDRTAQPELSLERTNHLMLNKLKACNIKTIPITFARFKDNSDYREYQQRVSLHNLPSYYHPDTNPILMFPCPQYSQQSWLFVGGYLESPSVEILFHPGEQPISTNLQNIENGMKTLHYIIANGFKLDPTQTENLTKLNTWLMQTSRTFRMELIDQSTERSITLEATKCMDIPPIAPEPSRIQLKIEAEERVNWMYEEAHALAAKIHDCANTKTLLQHPKSPSLYPYIVDKKMEPQSSQPSI